MSAVNIWEAKTHLSRLMGRLESGTEREIVIARNGRPLARLVPLEEQPAGGRIGVARGRFIVLDSIDAANPEIELLFAGESSS